MSLFTGNEVAIITGASSGIGEGTAIRLAQKGVSKLCLTGRNLEALKTTKRKCIEESGCKISEDNILLVAGDLTKEETCSQIVSSVIEKFNRIDILVNNAGIAVTEPFETCTIKEYDTQMDINVRSVIMLTQKCVPYLKVTKGNIVNVSSVSAFKVSTNLTYYSMTKAALDMFTKSVSVELAPSGIRVNSVSPGVIPTNVLYRAGWDKERYQQVLKACKVTHPLGRHGEVEEVANLITFLASKEASFITGTIVPVDGGLSNS